MPLAPPSEVNVFASFEDLFAAVNQHAAGEGYAVTIKRSKKNKKRELRKVWLRCDHGGQFKPKGFAKRETTSRRSECPFESTATLDSGLELWSVSIKNPDHNHPPTIAGAHPIHRKTAMTAEIKENILHQTRVHSTAKHILSSLRLDGNPNNPLLKPKDICNQQAQYRSKKLGPLTPIQALMRDLHQHESWWMAYGADHANQIDRLFFVKTTSYKVLKQNYEVLLMDSTYKRNFYRMPLCIISGVTPLNTSFYVGFCFLSSESVEEYQWVFDCIKKLYIELVIPDPTVLATDGDRSIIKAIAATPKIFPAAKHLLCLWHMNKNVVSNCKRLFDSDDWLEFNSIWQGVLYANTEEIFEEKWAAMEIKYHDNWLAMDYLRDEFINPHKEKVIRCYTNQVMHFGNTATSRAESQHRRLKGFLHSSTGDLGKVVDAISLLLINEREDYAIAFDQDKFQLPTRLRKDILSNLAKFVTTYAMRRILEQVERFLEMSKKGEPLRPCTRTFTRSLGLPCLHTIERRLFRNQPLQIGDVHPHWRFYKPRPTRDANASDIWDDWPPGFERDENYQYGRPESSSPERPVIPISESREPTPEESSSEDHDFDYQSGIIKPTQDDDDEFEPLPTTTDVDPILEVRAPLKVKTKGRPPGATNKRTRREIEFDNSTRRELSRFEHEAQEEENNRNGRSRKKAKVAPRVSGARGNGTRANRARGNRGRGGRVKALNARGGKDENSQEEGAESSEEAESAERAESSEGAEEAVVRRSGRVRKVRVRKD